MSKKRPVFDITDCVSCGVCAEACPLSCLTMTKRGRQGKYKNVFPELTGEGCIGCGICEKSCPMDVIRMEETGEAPA